MNGETTTRRAIGWIAGLGLASLLAGFAAAIFADPATPVRSAQNDAFSRSALGHRAFVELLRRLDRRVVVSRSPQRSRDGGVLILLEPPAEAGRLRELLDGVERVLCVLPKRSGEESERRPGWIESAEVLAPGRAEAVLDALGLEGEVRRSSAAFVAEVGRDLPAATLGTPQLVDGRAIEPVLASAEGSLIGWTAASYCDELWLLADPDLIQNHGLGAGENAALAVALIDRIAEPGEILVVDETLHGHGTAPHVFGALGRFPLVLALLQAALLIGVLCWIASRRFGAPLPEPPALRPGRVALVESTAGLLLHGGHSASTLRRYLAIEERRVAAARGLPRDLGQDARRAALAGLERRRPPAVALATLVEQVEDGGEHGGALLACARRIQVWRTEMLHGHR
jgi:hypothetical protein